MTDYTFKPIGIVESCYKQKFATPRQPGLASEGRARIRLNSDFDSADAVTGLEHCTHIWLQFVFHETLGKGGAHRVRPPRLGGNARLGVFATRSTHRPNPIGLSVVRLENIDFSGGVCLHVSGIDIIDGTPVLDIKPYLPYADMIPGAKNEIATAPPATVPVVFSEAANKQLLHAQKRNNLDLKKLIFQMLSQDPRPAYQKVDESRLYGVNLLDFELLWRYRESSEGLEIHVETIK